MTYYNYLYSVITFSLTFSLTLKEQIRYYVTSSMLKVQASPLKNNF